MDATLSPALGETGTVKFVEEQVRRRTEEEEGFRGTIFFLIRSFTGERRGGEDQQADRPHT